MGPIWGPPGADRTQVGPMLAPWILFSGKHWFWNNVCSQYAKPHHVTYSIMLPPESGLSWWHHQMEGNIFRFVRGNHRSLVDSPHKGQWRGMLMFSLICTWTNSWANDRDAGDLKRHRAHYDVTVMIPWCLKSHTPYTQIPVNQETKLKCFFSHSKRRLLFSHRQLGLDGEFARYTRPNANGRHMDCIEDGQIWHASTLPLI